MKLTNEEVAKVFAMYFMSCNVFEFTVNRIRYESDNNLDVIGYILEGSSYQMGLTPLSKISDKDAIEVAKLYGLHMKKGNEIGGWSIVDAIGEVKYKILKGDCLNELPYSCYQYLISQSYAVPLFFAPGHWANGKTAIELGIAIEKIEMI